MLCVLISTQAVWSRFFPAVSKVRELLSGGELGEVKCVTANFGYSCLHVPRMAQKGV